MSLPLHRYVDFRLYSFFRSSASYRVRIALNLKGVKYNTIPVDLKTLFGNTDKTLPKDFISLNPMEQVPLLQFKCSDGASLHQLTQSIPIIEFLDEAFPDDKHPLLPQDIMLRARTRQVSEIINSGIQPMQNIRLIRQVKVAALVGGEEGKTTDGVGLAKDAIIRGLGACERIAESSFSTTNTSRFAMGTQYPTMADILLVPQIYNARKFNINLSAYPNLIAVAETCEKLDAFKQAAPENQPDFV